MHRKVPVRFGPGAAGKGPAPQAPRRRPTGVTPDLARPSATSPDTKAALTPPTRPSATSSDETRLHGMQKIALSPGLTGHGSASRSPRSAWTAGSGPSCCCRPSAGSASCTSGPGLPTADVCPGAAWCPEGLPGPGSRSAASGLRGQAESRSRSAVTSAGESPISANARSSISSSRSPASAKSWPVRPGSSRRAKPISCAGV